MTRCSPRKKRLTLRALSSATLILIGGCCCCPIVTDHRKKAEEELEVVREELARLEDAKERALSGEMSSPDGSGRHLSGQEVIEFVDQLDERIEVHKARSEDLEDQADGPNIGDFIRSVYSD